MPESDRPLAKDPYVRFCDKVDLAIESEPDKAKQKAAIADAASQLLEDVAIELMEVSSKAFTVSLLGILRSGKYPGRFPDDSVHELAQHMVAYHALLAK